jgi:hypothetical protein
MKRSLCNSLVLAAVFVTAFGYAALDTRPIPRTAGPNFLKEGLFEGGKDARARLQNLRYYDHSEQGFERWVFDFADSAGQQVNAVAPRFQMVYQEAEKMQLPNGKMFVKRPAKVRFIFRAISKNGLTPEKVQALADKSAIVDEIHLYPPIEQGDMALEFVLRDDALFQPHQPLEKEGRLVLDLKARTESETGTP